MIDNELAEQLAVTAELTGTDLSIGAAKVLAEELASYDRLQVLGALRRCRRELKGRLTVAAVLERLEDGRPGAEEAWAMIPRDEGASVVWSNEMSQAFAVAGPMIADGDMVAARMAFKETYHRLVQAARDRREPARWTPSLGHDPGGREAALSAAVEAGRLTHQHAQALCPSLPPPSENVLQLLSGVGNGVAVAQVDE